MNTTFTTKNVASLIGVTPRTTGRATLALDGIKERAFAEARYCSDLPIGADYLHIGSVAQRVQHATATGRIHSSAACDFREMTPYTVCKLVLAVASTVKTFAGMTDDDAVAIIRDAIKEV